MNVNIGKRVLINFRGSAFYGQHGIVRHGGPYTFDVEINGSLWCFHAEHLLLDPIE